MKLDNIYIKEIFDERSGKYFELFNNQDLADAKAIREISKEYFIKEKKVIDIVK